MSLRKRRSRKSSCGLPPLPATYSGEKFNTNYELKLHGDLDAVDGDFQYSSHTAGALGTENSSREGTWTLARSGVIALRVRKSEDESEYGFHDREVSSRDPDYVIKARLFAGGRGIAMEGRRLTRCKRDAEEDLERSGMHVQRAKARQKKGDTDGALEDYAEAIRLNPDSIYARCQSGMLLQKLGRWAEATAEFDEAIKLDPWFYVARYYRGLARMRAGNRRGAAADLARALEVAPRNWEHRSKARAMLDALRR